MPNAYSRRMMKEDAWCANTARTYAFLFIPKDATPREAASWLISQAPQLSTSQVRDCVLVHEVDDELAKWREGRDL